MKKYKDGQASHRRWGPLLAVLTWWAFYCALITGIVLAFHYRPWGDVFKTVSLLFDQLPYGTFIRKLHYLSGQCFLLLVLAHTLDHFIKRTYHRILTFPWIKLISFLICSFALIFTGFILKGDQKGRVAGQVMYALASEIPFCGSSLARLFLRPGEDFFLLPYLYHCVILPLAVILLLSSHRKQLLPRGDMGWPLLAILSLLAVFYPLPQDIPPGMEVLDITGPWFFHGVQLLLRYVPPLWAGVVWPLTPFILLALFPLTPPRLRHPMRQMTAAVWCLHVVFLMIAWCQTLLSQTSIVR